MQRSDSQRETGSLDQNLLPTALDVIVLDETQRGPKEKVSVATPNDRGGLGTSHTPVSFPASKVT